MYNLPNDWDTMSKEQQDNYIASLEKSRTQKSPKLTEEQKQEFVNNLIKQYKEKHKLFPKQKLMYLSYARPTQIDRNLFYLLAFTFIFATIPSLYLGITMWKAIMTFVLMLFMTLCYCSGFIVKEDVVAYSE